MTTSSGRDERGRFGQGNPGGPGAPRQRSRNDDLRQAVLSAVAPEHVAALMRLLTRRALEGDMKAARLVLDRTLGRPREDAPDAVGVDLDLPPLQTAEQCAQATDAILRAVCDGRVHADTARTLTAVVQVRLRSIETIDLERRLQQLEQQTGQGDTWNGARR